MSAIEIGGVSVSTAHFIDNQRVTSKRTIELRTPIDDSLLGTVSAGGAVEVEAAVAAARRAFPAWAALGASGRRPFLDRLAELIDRDRELFAQIETIDTGFPIGRFRTRFINRTAQVIRYFARLAEELTLENVGVAPNMRTDVVYDPAGIAAIITPWNMPLILGALRAGPALAAGNTVVLKPAEWAPLSTSRFADLIVEAGFPPGVFNLVQGLGEDAGAALVAHRDVDRIAFTGSSNTGRLISTAAARTLTPVSLEMGGKSPLVIFDDADMNAVVEAAVQQYEHAGQMCMAATRIIIDEKLHDRFVEGLTKRVAALRIGDPRDPETELGPLITREHFANVEDIVERAKRRGARAVFGGKPSSVGPLFYEPTLLAGAVRGSEILEREIFGPVLTLQTFVHEEEAIALANDTAYGLGAAVYTVDPVRAQRVAARVIAASVWVNCWGVRDIGGPIGGAKRSGVGREGGRWSFDFYCEPKAIVTALGTP